MKKLRMLCFLLLIAMLTCPVAMAEAFTGNGAGNNGDIVVSITMDGDALAAIEVLEHSETAGISDPAFAAIPEAIIAYQSVAVDGVSGATNTSNGIIAAVTMALESAGADMTAFSTAPVIEATPTQHTDLTTDVVIVGGGGAGLAAAVTATDAGASVILLEKMAALGGNTLASGGIYNCADPELMAKYEMTPNCTDLIETALGEAPSNDAHAALQAAVRADYDAYLASGSTSRFDSANWYALQTWNGGDKLADLTLVQTLADDSLEGYEWLVSKGMTFMEELRQGAGALYPRTHTSTDILGNGYLKTYNQDPDAKGDLFSLMLNTAGMRLLTDGDKVVGVYAEDRQGNTFDVYANEVILATGGFSANVDMRVEYNTSGKWATLDESIPTTNMPGITGDGIAMALEIGANLVGMEQIQLLYLGDPKNGTTNGLTLRGQSADYVVFVNKNGERFVREDGRRDQICGALLQQPEGLMYVLESAADYDLETSNTLDNVPYRTAEANGDMFIAQTLEEMAQKIGCEAEVLQATLDAYNAMVDAGEDTLTDRAMLANKILEGPYVAVPRVASVHHTMGGIQIDAQCHVLRPDGRIIEGLLACGETTGDLHGGNRLGGNALVGTVVYGRIAGATATTP